MTGREPCPACHVLYQATVTGPCVHRPERRRPTGTVEAGIAAVEAEASTPQPPREVLYHEERVISRSPWKKER